MHIFVVNYKHSWSLCVVWLYVNSVKIRNSLSIPVYWDTFPKPQWMPSLHITANWHKIYTNCKRSWPLYKMWTFIFSHWDQNDNSIGEMQKTLFYSDSNYCASLKITEKATYKAEYHFCGQTAHFYEVYWGYCPCVSVGGFISLWTLPGTEYRHGQCPALGPVPQSPHTKSWTQLFSNSITQGLALEPYCLLNANITSGKWKIAITCLMESKYFIFPMVLSM